MSRRTTQVHSELKGASGTPGYMAPEMLRREVYDHRVDYFSLGCMVVEFVVGVCPFRTRDAAHWGGRKKKKKKKKEGVDRALLKQAKKEDARAGHRRRNQTSTSSTRSPDSLPHRRTWRGRPWRWRRT